MLLWRVRSANGDGIWEGETLRWREGGWLTSLLRGIEALSRCMAFLSTVLAGISMWNPSWWL